ncbi:pleckstrin homology domain-containing family A member kramer isoform X5 [Anticarsia gemmatalis]|uniref:pleckstrin homology domain-containing family A member kramer isoform X5 n=1 Tax=Anticarsia gemmatalis TaxID=129554 RepID=UPI003F76DEEF
MATAAPAASCMSTEHGCVMFDCLVHLWEWLDPPVAQSQYQMENKKVAPATQQPLTQQHLMAHHVHPDQIYAQQHPQLTHLSSSQSGQIQPNGVMHQLLQSQYHSNMNARSPLLENRHDLYGTGHNHDYARHYGANDNYNYPQSPPRHERTEVHTDHNVNHELHNIPKGYNAEVYQDYLKRNPPKDTNQIYQNHQPTYRPNVNPNQYGSKPYLPYSSRIGPQSNTELLRRQYSEIQQMKLQQQLHYQNQAQMHQQQKFAERQLLLQQIHGVQPPPNLQNSIYSDGSYRDLDRYSSKNDFKEYSSPDIQKDLDSFAKNNEYKEYEKHRQYQEAQWQNQLVEYRDQEQYRRPQEIDKSKSQSPPSDYNNQSQKNNIGVVSPMKSSESSTPSVKSPSSESRRSSGGNQALRSPIAQRIPSAPVTMSGILYKQGSDGLKVWRKRWFVLSEYCLFYYKSQDEEKLLGSVLLPSYKVSGCTAEDKVLRKFAFKLEHANMRTYILAAPDQEAMMKWVKALTMAALMQSPTDQPQKQSDRTAAKPEDGDEIPTYANAPPKPRRSNEGYNSPSPDMYDPNYDLLKKPASHYSQGTSHVRYQDHSNYPASPSQESTYTRSPQSPPSAQHQTQYQTKRPYDTQHLSLPLTNTVTDKLENNQPSTSSMYQSNPQSPYFDRNRSQQQAAQDMEQVYERQPQRNPFLQDTTPQGEAQLRSNETHGRNSRNNAQEERAQSVHNESGTESRSNAKSNVDPNAYNRDVYGELGSRPSRAGSAINERLLAERRTPDAYGRSTTMAAYNKGKIGDYEDVYGQYVTENEYGKTYAKSPNPSQDRDGVSISSHQQQQKQAGSYGQEKTFSGPSVLRRKKMQSSGIQPQMPRPHSADFLEYESKAEMLNKTAPARSAYDTYKEPQRPKSSLDINSYYDPSSDRYYSEESYAEKMRQSAQYLQQGLSATPRNMEIPLAKYASGLAKKQLSTAYSQMTNNNYEAEFSTNRDNASYASKYGDMEALNSNWTLKEKVESQKENYLNRSGSVLSDGSNVSGFVKEASKYDVAADGFMRSASARLPSTAPEKEGEKKVQQREESMKRLLEWKQRMLQSPLTRKSTPATISLARSLNQSRQSLRSDQYKPKTYTNASYNSYSSDDEASMTMSGTHTESGTNNNSTNQQALSKKAFLGSNTSIGRNSRDANIPVRAVSPRVRWVEDKSNDHYGSQQMSTSQQNLHALTATEDSWASARSPSRASQQPIRAVSPRVRRNTETDELQRGVQQLNLSEQMDEIPTAGELLGRTHEELVLLLIQLRRRHAATHRAIEQCSAQISSIEDCLSSLKAMEREESLQRLEQLKIQLMELEHQYEKSKPLVQLVDNMVKLGSLYNRPGSTIERLERNQRLRQKVLAEHALEQQRWLESVAAGKPLETEAARARVAELWALEQELADEAAILQGMKTDKDAIENLLTGVRTKFDGVHHKNDLTVEVNAAAAMSRRAPPSNPPSGGGLEAELARVQEMLAHNSKVYKKLEQTVADNARLERELQQLRRALQARRAAGPHQHHAQVSNPTAMLEDEVSRVQQLVSALQRQRQELSRAVRHLTQQSHALQTSHDAMPGKRRPMSSWQETNLDTGHTIDHGHSDYDYDIGPLLPPGHYEPTNMETPLYVDTRGPGNDVTSPLNSEDLQHSGFGNLSNVEKQEIKTVRIVKRESERRQRDRERSLQPMSDWPSNNITANLDQFLEEELIQSVNYSRSSSLPRGDKYDHYYTQPEQNYLQQNMDLSPKYVSSPSLSNYDFSQNISSLSSSYHKSYDRSGYDRMSLSTQYLNSPTDSSRTLTNDPLSKTSSVVSLTRSHMELSPIFKSEAAKQIITEMSGDAPKNGSLHRRQVPKEKRRHYTAPHHLSAKTLNEMPKDAYNQDGRRAVDDADMELVLRGAAPDVVRSALAPAAPAPAARRADNTIDQLLAAPQKILIPERYIPEKPPELSPEEQQKRQEKVESIKKMLTSTSADPNKSPDADEKRQREHLLQMNQILAKQVTEMSKIIAVKALEELPKNGNGDDLDDRSPDVELPIYQQRDNFFT